MMYLYANVTDAVVYVPVPTRGTVKEMKCVFNTATVEANDTIVASRGATAVNTLTATNTAGLVVETGVPDSTNKDLVFDPDSSTATHKSILLTPTGSPGSATVMIGFDPYATVIEAPKLA
jgi:hypothetical protein